MWISEVSWKDSDRNKTLLYNFLIWKQISDSRPNSSVHSRPNSKSETRPKSVTLHFSNHQAFQELNNPHKEYLIDPAAAKPPLPSTEVDKKDFLRAGKNSNPENKFPPKATYHCKVIEVETFGNLT